MSHSKNLSRSKKSPSSKSHYPFFHRQQINQQPNDHSLEFPEARVSSLIANAHFTTKSINKKDLSDYLTLALSDLEGIEQSPKYHPEGNALYHSLQVYKLSTEHTDDPELWAAALFHDLGKVAGNQGHANLGSEMLNGLLTPKICWLIKYHLHLMTNPRRTRSRLKGTLALRELEQLRKWDIGGRQTDIIVPTVQLAIASILEHFGRITSQQSDAIYSRSIAH